MWFDCKVDLSHCDVLTTRMRSWQDEKYAMWILLGSTFERPYVTELTERQKQCLQHALQRKTAKQIGRELGITHHAVEQHLKAARRKLGAIDTGDAARIFAATLATDNPYYRSPEVPDDNSSLHHHDQPELAKTQFRDVAMDRMGTTYDLSPRQTLAAIAVCALGLVVIMALIIAIAQGVAQLAP